MTQPYDTAYFKKWYLIGDLGAGSRCRRGSTGVDLVVSFTPYHIKFSMVWRLRRKLPGDLCR